MTKEFGIDSVGGGHQPAQVDEAAKGKGFLAGARDLGKRVLRGTASLPSKVGSAITNMDNVRVTAQTHPIRTMISGGIHLAVGGGAALIGTAINAGSIAGGIAGTVVAGPAGPAIAAGGLALGSTVASLGAATFVRGGLITATGYKARKEQQTNPELSDLKKMFKEQANRAIETAKPYKKDDRAVYDVKKQMEGFKVKMAKAKTLDEANTVQTEFKELLAKFGEADKNPFFKIRRDITFATTTLFQETNNEASK